MPRKRPLKREVSQNDEPEPEFALGAKAEEQEVDVDFIRQVVEAVTTTPSAPADGKGDDIKDAEFLKQRMDQRVEAELLEKTKTNTDLQEALEEQETSREKISVAAALVEYLSELQHNLEHHPEEYYCSLEIPSSK